MASLKYSERAPGGLYFYLPLAFSMLAYGIIWIFSRRNEDPSGIVWQVPAEWLITTLFLAAYFRWNGPKQLRRFSDEIRVIPHYRSLIAQLLFSDTQISRLALFFLLSMTAMFMISLLPAFLFLVWGTAGYFGLIATHIVSRLDYIPRRAAIAHSIAWGGMLLVLPGGICALIFLAGLFWSESGSDAIGITVMIIVIGAIVFALFLPLRIATMQYQRAMVLLRELDEAEFANFGNSECQVQDPCD